MSDDDKTVQLVKVVSDWAPEPLKLYAETLHNETRQLLTEGFKRTDGELKNIISTRQVMFQSIEERFRHTQTLFEQGQATAQRAVDKAEAAQGAHNIASNEWRGTLNDFKSTLVSRDEFNRLYGEFSAYRLSASALAAASAGAVEGKEKQTDNSRANMAIIISILTAVIILLPTVFNAVRPLTPSAAVSQQPIVIQVPAPSEQGAKR